MSQNNHKAGWIGMMSGLLVLWSTHLVFFWRQESRLGSKFENFPLGDIAMQYGIGSALSEKYAYLFTMSEFVFGISMMVSLFVYEGPQLKIFSCMCLGFVLILVASFFLRTFGPKVFIVYCAILFVGILSIVISITLLNVLTEFDFCKRVIVKSFASLSIISGGIFFLTGIVSVQKFGTFLPGFYLLLISFGFAAIALALASHKTSDKEHDKDAEHDKHDEHELLINT